MLHKLSIQRFSLSLIQYKSKFANLLDRPRRPKNVEKGIYSQRSYRFAGVLGSILPVPLPPRPFLQVLAFIHSLGYPHPAFPGIIFSATAPYSNGLDEWCWLLRSSRVRFGTALGRSFFSCGAVTLLPLLAQTIL